MPNHSRGLAFLIFYCPIRIDIDIAIVKIIISKTERLLNKKSRASPPTSPTF